MEEQNQDTPFLSHSIMNPKVLLIYGKSNIHLGLWKDLENDNRVALRATTYRPLSRMGIWCRKAYFKFDRHVFASTAKHIFFNYYDIYQIARKVKHIVVVDGALNQVNISELKKCKRLNPKVEISLYLINSMNADSPIMRGVRPKIGKFNWNHIYTFDKKDAEQFGYKYLGFNYYSYHHLKPSRDLPISNVFFVGGLKGGRTNLIENVYNYFNKNSVVCDFFMMPMGKITVSTLPGVYYYRGWRPYEEILARVQQTNCIIEIMQEGQNGASLRYFEAVCMNKKLLTNNPNIVDFPFYDSRWMRIFKTEEDIDIEWVKMEDNVDYGYQGEFSPSNFIDYLLKDEYEKV